MSDERRVFEYRLQSAHGEVDNEILDLACERLSEDGFIVERMEGCPVSRNLPAAVKRTLLHPE